MNREANRSTLISDGPCDGLANPPSGVSGEFVALLVVEFLRGTNQAQTAFLDEVLEAQAPIHVFLGD